MSLLYAAGERPAAGDVARFLDEPAQTPSQSAGISHRPDTDEGWLEILASGLTFDLSGLAPGPAEQSGPADHLFGLSAAFRALQLEAVNLTPGEHVAPGASMLPVVRIMCGLGARLAALADVRAVCWRPARVWMEPNYYVRIISAWLAGGAFPALGLTALERCGDGTVQSRGLAFFTGQELLVAPRAGESAAVTARLAVRLIDLLMGQGRLREATRISGPDGEPLLIEPNCNGQVVRVQRSR